MGKIVMNVVAKILNLSFMHVPLKATIHGATFVVRLCCGTKVASCLEKFHMQLLSHDKSQKGSHSHIRCYYGSKCTQLGKIDNKFIAGAFVRLVA